MKGALHSLLFAIVGSLTATPVHAQYVPGEFGSLPLLLTIPKVRAELAITPRQAAQLEALRELYRRRMRYLGVGGDASCTERAEAERHEINKEALAILHPTQRRRLPAIERRAQGATLLYSAELRKELGLSERQHRAIEHIRQKGVRFEERINRASQQGKMSRERRIELLRKERLKRARQVWNQLTPSQQRAFWQG